MDHDLLRGQCGVLPAAAAADHKCPQSGWPHQGYRTSGLSHSTSLPCPRQVVLLLHLFVEGNGC
jgi:hypothetical protein